jgi:hypothetical protein
MRAVTCLALLAAAGAFLAVVSDPPQAGEDPPVLHSLRGTLKKANRVEYRRHLARKHR